MIKQTETYSNIKTPMSTTPHESASAINVQPHARPPTHCSQIIPFYDTSFFKYKNNFQGFFLPDDYSLDLKTPQSPKTPQTSLVYTKYILNPLQPITPLLQVLSVIVSAFVSHFECFELSLIIFMNTLTQVSK